VNGEWVQSTSGKTLEVTDPGNAEKLGDVPDMAASDCEKVIGYAEEAQKKWRDTLAKERADVLRRMYDLHLKHVDDLAELLSLESGKHFAEAKGEIFYGTSFLEWFSEEARRMYGETVPEAIKGRRIFTYKEPIGVCGLITPWNFPNAMLTRKIGPAIAAGCAVVCKPASETPYSALAIAEIAHEAGLPPGVLNVITSSSSSEIGKELTSDDRVRKISFTGSTRVGKMLYKQCADTVKKISMELGGNAPFIVFDDANLELALDQFMVAKFRSNAQACVAANFIYVQDGVYDRFAKMVADKVAAMKVGHFKEEGVSFGPVINEAAVKKMESFIEDASGKNAKVLVGGSRIDRPGFYFPPTVVSEVTDEMRLAQEEIFGPIAPMIRFKTEEEVLERCNRSKAGLASYFFTNDLSRAFRMSKYLENGMVGVNTGLVSTTVAPFGGVKESGLGREGSKHGIDDYCEIKYVAMQVE